MRRLIAVLPTLIVVTQTLGLMAQERPVSSPETTEAPKVSMQAPVPQAVKALRHLKPAPYSGPFSWTNGPYEYDGAGDIKAIGSEQFLYDKVGRLRSATVRGPDLSAMQTQAVTYDGYGNVTSMSKLGQTVDLSTSITTNRLQSAGYDASGNLTASGTVQYSYDATGTLNAVRVGDSQQPRIIYTYTADDERLFSFEVSTGITHWTLRGFDNQVLRDFRQQGGNWSIERDYVYRDGLLLAALKTGGAVEHYSLDHLGTPRLVTDAAGHKIGYHVYWPFGEEWSPGNPQEASPLKFTGHERDLDIAGTNAPLDYMHARYYGSQWARFLSVDPARESADPARPQSWNRYAYTENHPLNLVDVDGQSPAVVVEAVLEEAGVDAAVDYVLGMAAALVGLEAGSQASEADSENKPTGDEAPPPMGATGQKVDSKTLWPPKNQQVPGEPRVDVENPAPGEREGQVHIQKGKEKYTLQRSVDENHNWQYQFRNADSGGKPPGWVRNLLKDPEVRDAILKGMQRYLNERGFNFSKLVR